MIVIIDYGVGNLGSILNMLKKVGVKACISNDENIIRSAEKLLLPGVGSFDAGMQRLNNSNLRPVLDDCVLQLKKPVLGICLGMQLMAKKSDEGILPGLGWIDADVKKIQIEDSIMKIPHMGWNTVEIAKPDPLLDNLPEQSRFYFVHSYKVICHNPDDILMNTIYGQKFTSAFRTNNCWGVQFHPEKSHRYGMHLLKNFSELASSC